MQTVSSIHIRSEESPDIDWGKAAPLMYYSRTTTEALRCCPEGDMSVTALYNPTPFEQHVHSQVASSSIFGG